MAGKRGTSNGGGKRNQASRSNGVWRGRQCRRGRRRSDGERDGGRSAGIETAVPRIEHGHRVLPWTKKFIPVRKYGISLTVEVHAASKLISVVREIRESCRYSMPRLSCNVNPRIGKPAERPYRQRNAVAILIRSQYRGSGRTMLRCDVHRNGTGVARCKIQVSAITSSQVIYAAGQSTD